MNMTLKIMQKGKFYCLQKLFNSWDIRRWLCRRGTLITGCVRSGTTLALRVYAKHLSVAEERAGSALNEPRLFSNMIVNKRFDEALDMYPFLFLNRERLVKSPHVALLLPELPPLARLIVTFRDVRFIVASMLQHHASTRLELPVRAYWEPFAEQSVPMNYFERALLCVETFYRRILNYPVDFDVWNYGVWADWTVNSKDVRHLYEREAETSAAVRKQALSGVLFSNESYNMNYWEKFCDAYGVTKEQKKAAQALNDQLKDSFASRGKKIYTVEDITQAASC